MKNVLKIFKFELYKLISNKKLLVSFAVFILALFIFSAYSHNDFYLSQKEWEQRQTLSGNINPNEYTEEYRQEILDSYILALENAEENLENALENGTELEIWDCQNDVSILNYLLETNTIKEDYIDYKFIDSLHYNYYGTPFLFSFFSLFKYIIIFIVVLLTTIIIIYEYKSGTSRYILSSPTTRRQILLGKLLYIFIVTLFLTLLCVAFAYGVALYYGCNSAITLIITKNGLCYTVSIYTVFWRQIIGILIISILFSCLTLFIGYVIKNHIVSLLLPFGFYLLLYYILQFFIEKGYDTGSYVYGYINYFPILNMIEQNIYFWSDFALILLYNLFLAIVLLILSIIFNRKKEY